MSWSRKLLCVVVVAAAQVGAVGAQNAEESTVEAASEVLREIMAIPAKSIPESLLADAHGVAIIPAMLKGGFIVGVRHGKGVILTRDAAGAWVGPVFITVTGGSVGWQAGLQSTDVIVVFRNRRGVDGLMRGKFTIGADASVAAGPVGREAMAATDGKLRAEILSYSRSRGLFVGVAIDGAVMQVDHRANRAYYAPRPGQPEGPAVPGAAVKLVEQIASYAGPNGRLINVRTVPIALPPMPVEDLETLRTRVAEASLRLQPLLDAEWKQYLALPGEIYAEGKMPAKDLIDRCLTRYRAVATNANYQNLSTRAEFQDAYALLQRYCEAVHASTAGTLKLPPPPK
jgi:lipid-binding SYLF domain-containing protein